VDRAARDRLVVEHWEWAQHKGRKLAKGYVDMCGADGIDGIVAEALLAAASRYEHGRVPFKAWASFAIRNAVRDALRRIDDLTRDEREALRTGKTVRWRKHYRPEAVLLDYAPPPEIVEDIDHRRGRTDIRRRARKLPARLWFVVDRTLRDRTLAEIGAEMGLTESRVCQLLKEATERLRAAPP
jgi:RNA polymerase sigma factor (sigma-70 family)